MWLTLWLPFLQAFTTGQCFNLYWLHFLVLKDVGCLWVHCLLLGVCFNGWKCAVFVKCAVFSFDLSLHKLITCRQAHTSTGKLDSHSVILLVNSLNSSLVSSAMGLRLGLVWCSFHITITTITTSVDTSRTCSNSLTSTINQLKPTPVQCGKIALSRTEDNMPA